MSLIHWPPKLAALSVNANPAPRSTGGSPTLSGFEQNIGSSAGVWSIVFEHVPVVSPEHIKLWRSTSSKVQGRINRLLVPIRDRSEMRPGGNEHRTTTTFDGGVTFSDGSAFANDIGTSIDATARGATEITVNGPVDLLDVGQRFSIGYRLYEITAVGDIAGSTLPVEIWPPLRDPAVDRSALNFMRPQCKVRLATDNEMHLSLTVQKFGSKTVQFIEDAS